MKTLLRTCIVMILISLAACATQRYGRQSDVSDAEKSMLTCREIQLEIAKAEEFLSNLRMQRADTSGAHVLGFLGDFGIGNAMEGDAAELSGQKRLKQLKDLSVQKNCGNTL